MADAGEPASSGQRDRASEDDDERPYAAPPPLRAAIGSMDTLGALALAWLDYDLKPRLIVSGDLLILWPNTAARSALASRRDLENRLGALAMVNPSQQDALAGFLAKAGAVTTSWCAERGDGDGHLIVRAQRIDWLDGGVLGIGFFGTGSDFSLGYANLAEIFGLTPAEHVVLIDLLDGRAAEAIATHRTVSVETTRSHIRKIYAKLGVNSRELLFRRCQAFRL